MPDPKKPATPETTPTPAPEPNKGGFGAFAEVYRARWAANHPNMRPRESATSADATSADATPEPRSPSDSSPGEKPRRAADGARLLRLED
jgi:hypothetical protein